MPRAQYVEAGQSRHQTARTQEGRVLAACNALTSDVLAALTGALAERSPTAIRLGKHALHAVQDMTLAQCLDYMTLMLDRLAQTEDAAEGFAAFGGKRKPVWTGR